MKTQQKQYDIYDLLILLLENDLNDSQRKYLIEWSQNEPEAVAIYHGFMRSYAVVSSEISGRVEPEFGTSVDTHFDQAIWTAMAEYEKNAAAIELPPEKPQPELIRQVVYPPLKKRKMSKFQLFTFIASAAALVFLMALLKLSPQREMTAEVVEAVNPQWAVPSEALTAGQYLYNTDRPRYLKSGYLKIRFNYGATVVLEGPCEFSCKTDGLLNLDSGSVFARVPASAKGFTVDTPSARIIDVGTEFGIRVERDKTASVHMLKGRALLIPGQKGKTEESQMLTAGTAKNIDSLGQVIDVPVQQQKFVRVISSRSELVWRGQSLNLADMIGGGNGLGTGSMGKWINLSNGKDGTDYFSQGERVQGIGSRNTDYRYHPVLHLPYVDGVFCPDGDNGPVQISTRGDVWSDCPDTTGICFEDIYNGSDMKQRKAFYELTFDERPYGTRDYPAIAIHANAGITFDLEALRNDMPGIQFTRFAATCGLTKSARSMTDKNKIDFWVLVDGRVRFKVIGRDESATSHDISVPLTPYDRFLTLVSTDGGQDAGYDWGFFAEPRLEIEAVE